MLIETKKTMISSCYLSYHVWQIVLHDIWILYSFIWGTGCTTKLYKRGSRCMFRLCQILIKNTAYDYIDKPMGAHGLPWAGHSEIGIGLGFGPSAQPTSGWADKKYKNPWAHFPRPSPAHPEPCCGNAALSGINSFRNWITSVIVFDCSIDLITMKSFLKAFDSTPIWRLKSSIASLFRKFSLSG